MQLSVISTYWKKLIPISISLTCRLTKLDLAMPWSLKVPNLNGFSHLNGAGLDIKVFVSDRHKGIVKWIRECNPATTHFFDQWHIAKGVVKKMLAASKAKDCEVIAKWVKAVKNHMYWCSTSTKAGFQSMILAKWKSLLQHISNEHKEHPDPLFQECAHNDDIEPRQWIKKGVLLKL